MSKELVISGSPHETRVAIVEDGQLCEIYIEREKEFALVGSLYKGRVTRVLPGMQSAFVDIGLDSDAFLYVSDFLENLEDYDHVAAPPPKAHVSAPAAASPRNEEVAPARPAAARESAPPLESGEQAASLSDGGGGDSSAQESLASSAASAAPAQQEHAEQPQQSRSSHHQQGNPPNEQRPNRGQGGFGGDRGGDRGRHGRRWGRRGRGGRQGRELPSSKYTSPSGSEPRPSRYSSPSGSETRGHEHQPYEPPPAGYQPILLPGESLAKYKDRAPSAAPAHDEAQASAAAPALESPNSENRNANAELTSGLPSALYATPGTTAETPSPLHPESQTEVSTGSRFSYAQPFSPASPANEDLKSAEEESEDLEMTAADASIDEADEEDETEGEEIGTPLSDEEMSALAAQLVDVKHEEAQAGVEEAAEAAMVPFVEEAELEELEDALNEAIEDTGGEAESLGEELHDEDLHDEELHQEELHAEESAEAIAGQAGASGDAQPSAEMPHAADSQPINARVSQPPRARFQRPMRRGGRNRRRGGGQQEQRSHHHQQQRRPQLISEVLKAGQEIIVQIAKEPLGKKGARITSHVALPGRFLVYMPTVDHIGVSHRIGSVEDRSRLRRVVTEAKGTFPGGFIVRTAAASATDDEIRNDAEFLGRTWDSIRNSSEQRHAPALLHRDLNLVERILRDYLSDDYAAIWIDNEEEYGKVLEFVGRFQPRLINRVKLYTKETPIFEEFGIQQELDKALRPKVWLKSGGYIVINHTEALVAIDVNTGKFVGRGSTRLEDTIVRTNLEAVNEIVRQIRLRDLGGIIVVDFIDMEERRNREKVLSALEQALHQDRAPSKALAFNEFGLVCITRKRTKQALERVLCQPCPYCTGSGMVKSIPTICYEIQAEARKMSVELESRSVTLRVNPEIAKALKTRESLLIEELEQVTRKSVIIQSDPTLHWEQYDIY